MSFKQNLWTKYSNKCPISGAHHQECDAVHIIQKFICNRLDLNHLITNSDNGLLLFTGFHRTFDRYKWTLDVYRVQFSPDLKWCWLPILVPPQYKSYFIYSFSNQLIKVSTASIPYLWVDFQIFLFCNFQRNSCNQEDLINQYFNLIHSKEFDQLSKNPLLMGEVQPSSIPQVILDHHSSQNHFLVLNYHNSWISQKWMSAAELPSDLIEIYQKLVDEEADQDYNPRTGGGSSNYLSNSKKVYNLRNKRNMFLTISSS